VNLAIAYQNFGHYENVIIQLQEAFEIRRQIGNNKCWNQPELENALSFIE